MKNFILVMTAVAGIYFLKVTVKRDPVVMKPTLENTTAYNSSSH
ncbi:hypothetical protein [Peredibacter starrii]|uniref:Uncharacterized protein n=1 Tax=Peredibacter starrii TaxID=28202 RepID=A0AAX4HKA0_9BACT|nr:hypothetical protein [Peredibacter starrii]WPU63634.1 hypothetical protein SOO65_13140 [Peredibacter starrii]